jgi:hypothetical protein
MSAVQRAYFYLVALVAVHMVVLGVANLLRVGAEIVMGAPSGGFTGLPFVFNEFSQPRELYREQAALAIALLVVGIPAWLIHFGLAERAARRSPAERAAALRSFYLHLVIFVTALLVFGYGQRTLRLVLQGGYVSALPEFSFEPDWQARAAGAGAMVLAALGALAYHLRLALGDRRVTLITGRAAYVRGYALYGLAVVGLFFAAFNAALTLDGLWDRLVADSFVTLQRSPSGPLPPFGNRPPLPTQDELLRFQLLGQVPPIVAGIALWLATWIPLGRGFAAATPQGAVERASVPRKLAIYLIVAVSAVTVLVSATFFFTSLIRRALGDPFSESFTSVWHDIGTPVAFGVVFAAIWLFHRRVVLADAAREAETERAAGLRRLYTYLISAIGLAMAAFGAAGAIGVLGSQAMGINTHSNSETATYISLVIAGVPAWAFHFLLAQRQLDDAERRSIQRRGYLYLAILGGALGVLVFGSAMLYRLFNATLAASFPLATWHDLWHFAVDASVSATALVGHLRIVFADRAALAPAVAEEVRHPVTVLVRAADAAAARARLATALEGQADISIP